MAGGRGEPWLVSRRPSPTESPYLLIFLTSPHFGEFCGERKWQGDPKAMLITPSLVEREGIELVEVSTDSPQF